MWEKWLSISPKMRKLIIFLLVLLVLVLNVGVAFNPFDNGGCISVTFDKLPMLLVNRAVLCVDGKEYNISDSVLTREISQKSIVATNTDLCSHKTERWIDLYCGNVRIRRIYWETNHDAFIVYKASLIHWIIPSSDGNGLVSPSEDVIAKLESIIKTG